MARLLGARCAMPQKGFAWSFNNNIEEKYGSLFYYLLESPEPVPHAVP